MSGLVIFLAVIWVFREAAQASSRPAPTREPAPALGPRLAGGPRPRQLRPVGDPRLDLVAGPDGPIPREVAYAATSWPSCCRGRR